MLGRAVTGHDEAAAAAALGGVERAVDIHVVAPRGELVATQAGDHVGASEHLGQEPRHRHQRRVAGGVAGAVVDPWLK